MRFHLNILFISTLLTTAYPCFDFVSAVNQSYPSEPPPAAPTVVVNVEPQSPNLLWSWVTGITLVWVAYLVTLDRVKRHELELQINQIQRWQREIQKQQAVDRELASSQLSSISKELGEERFRDSGAQHHLLRIEAQLRSIKTLRPKANFTENEEE